MKKMNKTLRNVVFIPTLIVGISFFAFSRIFNFSFVGEMVYFVLVGTTFLICYSIYHHKETKKMLSDIYDKLEALEKKDE